MYIFGAGQHTRWLLDVIADLPPPPPIECIIDDAAKAGDEIKDIPVRRPVDVRIDEVALILISSDRCEEALSRRARETWGERVEIVRLYEGLPPGPYDKSDARSDALRLLAGRSKRGGTTSRSVVIISDHPRSREAKIGFALHDAGWSATLLHGATPTFDAGEFFDRTIRYTNPWAALKLACDERPTAYHVMVSQDYRLADLFVRHRPGPVIVDPYDLIAGMCTDEFLRAFPSLTDEIPRERFCLENADAVCCRSREAQWLSDRMGYQYRRLLHFPDGCWNSPESCTTRLDGLHVAYAGGLELPFAGAPEFAAGGLNLAVANRMVEQGIELHIFPSANQWSAQSEHFTHKRWNDPAAGGLHLHRPVPADRIVGELSRFGFGICVFTENVVRSGAPWRTTPDKIATCTTNKLFDYLDAGLPIIHNAPVGSLIAEMVSTHGAGIDVAGWPVETWGRRLRAIDADSYRPELAAAREAYDVRREIHRLVAFYEDVQRDSRPERTRTSTGVRHDDPAGSRTSHRPALV